MTTRPFFSIIIPTLNEEKYLPLLLKDLTKQTFTDFEVLVIDGKSEDRTVAYCQKYEAHLNVTVMTSSERNVSVQRNLGISKAKAPYILFMDADNRLPRFFLEGIKYQVTKNPDVDIFTTWIKVESRARVDQAIEKAINLGYEVYKNMGKPSAMGAFIGCKKKVTATVKFDKSQSFAEDGQFVQTACQKGFEFMVFHDPSFYYSLRRLKKEGALKSVGSTALLQLRYLQGKGFQDEDSYPMLGGSYYETGNPESTIINTIQKYLANASKKQLDYLKKVLLLQSLSDEE
jgi:glycosyltransferase involved in cell wall biosynthesis